MPDREFSPEAMQALRDAGISLWELGKVARALGEAGFLPTSKPLDGKTVWGLRIPLVDGKEISMAIIDNRAVEPA